MQKKLPKISDAEWQVMKAIWARHPISASEITEALTPVSPWKPKTILTMVNRLVAKGAIGYRQKGRANEYFPLVSEEECTRAESRSFLDRVYGGAITPMLSQLFEVRPFSRQEIEELKNILDRKGKKP
ncbi:MAG: BlaI/MecI/CopY family transcriptional regulator [Candidatus Sumerlaeia bacterium]